MQLHAEGRLPHAICVSAAPGWGHLEFAQRLGAHLLDIDAEAGLSAQAHPDLRWLEPDGSVIKIEQVRGLINFAVQTAQIASCKVAVLAQADALNENAANALLKTLEEPPPGTFLVLATERWSQMLPTVRSRCQRLLIPGNWPMARHWLLEQGLNEATVNEAEAEMGQAPLSCLRRSADQPSLAEWLAGVPQRSLEQSVKALEGVPLADWLGRWQRHLTRWIAERSGESHVEQRVFDFADLLMDSRRQLLSSNSVNEKLMLELLVHRWQRLAE